MAKLFAALWAAVLLARQFVNAERAQLPCRSSACQQDLTESETSEMEISSEIVLMQLSLGVQRSQRAEGNAAAALLKSSEDNNFEKVDKAASTPQEILKGVDASQLDDGLASAAIPQEVLKVESQSTNQTDTEYIEDVHALALAASRVARLTRRSGLPTLGDILFFAALLTMITIMALLVRHNFTVRRPEVEAKDHRAVLYLLYQSDPNVCEKMESHADRVIRANECC